MMYPSHTIPAYLPSDEYDRLVKLLAMHFSYPLPYPLAGAYFEQLFGAAVGGYREQRKLLYDVLRGRIGWSLKTLLKSNMEIGDSFEVVIQRCDILRDQSLSLDSPVKVLGEHILQHFNIFAEDSSQKQDVGDPRAAFLIRNRAERDFTFFQHRYRLYSPDEVQWRWANEYRRSLIGYVAEDLVLRWYRSGTQLFGVYRIPEGAQQFHIAWTRADLDETLAFFNHYTAARTGLES